METAVKKKLISSSIFPPVLSIILHVLAQLFPVIETKKGKFEHLQFPSQLGNLYSNDSMFICILLIAMHCIKSEMTQIKRFVNPLCNWFGILYSFLINAYIQI